MAELFQQLLQWVTAHPGWAGAVVFAIAFVESLAIVGVVVPGVAILFAVGALIGTGALEFWHMVSWAAAGAVLGDGLSFWIGKHYQHQLTSTWPFSKYPSSLQKGTAFFQRYGGKSVAIGRFFGPIRAVIPLVAGMMNMPTGRFIAANVVSAIAWAPAYLLPGMAFGASMELASEVALRLVVLLVTLVFALWFLGWFSHRVFLLLQPHSQDLLKAVLSLGEKYPRLGKIAGALGDPRHPEAAGLSALAGLLVATSLLLVLVSLIPINLMQIVDSSIHLPMQALATPAGNHIMLAISSLADSSTSLIILGIMWALLSIFRLPTAARHWLAGYGSVWLLSLGGHYLLLRHPSLLPSLPDLYVLRASVMYGLAAVLLSPAVAPGRRWIIYSSASVLVMAVILAQLYHGSNLSAILHALAFGVIWTAASGMAYRTHGYHEQLAKRRALLLGASILGLASLSVLSTSAPIYTPATTGFTQVMNAEDWWRSDWQRLPRSRDDVAHIKDHPLNMQYQGSIAALQEALQSSGWQTVDSDAGLDWLKLLSSADDMAQLPALPHSHEGKYESHQLVRIIRDQRLALHLWPSRYLLTPDGMPLWLGEVGTQQLKHKMGLFSYPVTLPDSQPALDQLADDLTGTKMQLRLVNDGTLLLLSSVKNPVN